MEQGIMTTNDPTHPYFSSFLLQFRACLFFFEGPLYSFLELLFRGRFNPARLTKMVDALGLLPLIKQL